MDKRLDDRQTDRQPVSWPSRDGPGRANRPKCVVVVVISSRFPLGTRRSHVAAHKATQRNAKQSKVKQRNVVELTPVQPPSFTAGPSRRPADKRYTKRTARHSRRRRRSRRCCLESSTRQ